MWAAACLSLDQAWHLARIRYGNRMAPDWRRRTPQEAEAVLASLGLTGRMRAIAKTDCFFGSFILVVTNTQSRLPKPSVRRKLRHICELRSRGARYSLR